MITEIFEINVCLSDHSKQIFVRVNNFQIAVIEICIVLNSLSFISFDIRMWSIIWMKRHDRAVTYAIVQLLT